MYLFVGIEGFQQTIDGAKPVVTPVVGVGLRIS